MVLIGDQHQGGGTAVLQPLHKRPHILTGLDIQLTLYHTVDPVVNEHIFHMTAQIHDLQQLFFRTFRAVPHLEHPAERLICPVEHIALIGRDDLQIRPCPQQRHILHNDLPADTQFFCQRRSGHGPVCHHKQLNDPLSALRSVHLHELHSFSYSTRIRRCFILSSQISSSSSCHMVRTASEGIFQPALGDTLMEPTAGPSGRQLRLNCWVKKRR